MVAFVAPGLVMALTLEHQMRVGLYLHPVTFAKTASLVEACDLLVESLRRDDGRDPRLFRWCQKAATHWVRRNMLLWAARWASVGFPAITLGHKLAASMMATRIDARAMDDQALAAPWPAFLVLLPTGLIRVPDPFTQSPMTPDYVFVLTDPATPTQVALAEIWVATRASVALLPRSRRGLLDLEGDEDDAGEIRQPGIGEVPLGTAHERALDMVWRLMLGVVLEMDDPSRVRPPKSVSGGGRRDPREPPKLGVFTLTRDVVVDCRNAVREHIEGRRSSPPTVQALVRGHWKRQPCGDGGQSRRWIHVEPYWRGPEDAPVAVRPHRVGPA